MRKWARNGSIDAAVVDVWQRELGQLSTTTFARRLAGSKDLVLRLDLLKKLDKHRGCVNTVSFSSNGDILLSGSDDQSIVLWDWEAGRSKLSFHSGHTNNVLHAKIMPYSDDRSIVTCGADGQVRHASILELGHVETKMLANHQGRVHKMAVDPGSPHLLYTCSETGLVEHFDLRTGAAAELFTCRRALDISASIIHLYTIAIDPRNTNMFAVAGSYEYAMLYDLRKYKRDGSTNFGLPTDVFCPQHLSGNKVDVHGITGLAFSNHSELLVTYHNEFIYLFTKDMGKGSTPTSTSSNVIVAPQVYMGHINLETVKSVNFFGPNCEYVVSGSDCGRIFIWKKKDGELIRVIDADKHVVNCVESNPHTNSLASSGIESDIKIWTPKAIDRAALPTNVEKFPRPGPMHFTPTGAIDEYDDEDDDDDNISLDFSDDSNNISFEYYEEEEQEQGGDTEEEEEMDEDSLCYAVDDDCKYKVDYFNDNADYCCGADGFDDDPKW